MKNLANGTEKKTEIFFIGIIMIMIAITIMRISLTDDNYFMLANWREVLKNGFYTKDPLSIHHTYRASVEKWLSCALLYYLYNAFGMTGIYAVMAIMTLIIAYLVYTLCFYTSRNKTISAIFTTIMFAMGSVSLSVRPQTVTIIFLLIETLCLEHYARENQLKCLLILPMLSWLEMQFHSTIWPCFFIIMLPYLCDISVRDKKIYIDRKKTGFLLLNGLACFGTLFINPYGAWSVWYIFRSYGNKYMESQIAELHKPEMFGNSYMIVWVAVLIIALIFGNKKMPTRYWLLMLGLFCFMWTANRNEIFFDFIGAFPLCYMLREKKITLKYNLIPCLPVIVLGVFPLIIGTTTNVKEEADMHYVETLDKLAKNYGVNGEDIFCDFNAGSYAEYLGYHPYIDSRAEVFTKKINGREELWKEYTDMVKGSLYYKDFVDKYDFKYLVVDKSMEPSLYNGLIHNHNYQKLFQYKEYVVFES